MLVQDIKLLNAGTFGHGGSVAECSSWNFQAPKVVLPEHSRYYWHFARCAGQRSFQHTRSPADVPGGLLG